MREDSHSRNRWQSFHIFYKNDLNILLLNLIAPVLRHWYEQGSISNHFFIRYWEEGQHIRLRIKVSQMRNVDAIGDLNRIYESNFRSDFYDENFKIQVTDYVQELERYGGIHTIALAERAFEHSSTTVLDLLAQYEHCWNYGIAISLALQAHLLIVKELGNGVEDAISFLEFLSANYIVYSLPENGLHDVTGEVNRIKIFFQQAYLQQKDSIDYLCKKIWEGNHWDTQNWRYQWTVGMQKVRSEFNLISSTRRLENPKWLDEFPAFHGSVDLLSRWTVWSSFFHMTNNRFGIYLRDEAYLYYCLQRGLLALST